LVPAFASAAPKKGATPSNAIKKEFKEAILKNHRDFDRCGQAEHARTKRPVKGLVLVKFVVNGDGKVTESGFVHNTTKSKAIAECLVRTVEQMKFPATFGAPVVSTYPFKFNIRK
jgi:hypothetical protein